MVASKAESAPSYKHMLQRKTQSLPGLLVHTCNTSTWKLSRNTAISRPTWLHCKFQASLNYRAVLGSERIIRLMKKEHDHYNPLVIR